MKNICIVLNAFYPYNPGETFLANEIEYLAKFDHVFVAPIHGDPNSNLFAYNRRNYTNVEVWDIPVFDNKQKIIYSLRTLIMPDFYAEIGCLIKSKRLSVNNIFKALRFIAHSKFCSDSIMEKIRQLRICAVDNKIILYSYWMNLDAYVAALLKEKLGGSIQMITRGHRVDIYEYADANGYIPMRNKIFAIADKLYPIAEDGKKYLLDNYGVSTDKVRVSRLGTYDHGINISPKVQYLNVVSCSWMRKVKRLDLIVNALAQIDIHIYWTHYGDGEEMPNLIRDITSFNSGKFSYNFPGATPNDKVLSDYGSNNYNVFINVSSSEGVPVSIMEAMSFGKIIIATDVGGTKEIVHDNINGFLLPCDFEVQQLVNVLRKVYQLSDEDYNTMCLASRRIWEERCNAKRNYDSFVEDIIWLLMEEKEA